MIHRLAPLLAGVLIGCPYVSPQERDARYDQDGDGLLWHEDCDDQDENIGRSTTYYYDADGDGYGTENVSTESCDPVDNYVTNDEDCDDIDASRNPETWWYPDSDNDSYGSLLGLQVCEQPADGYYLTTGDCNDGDAEIHPGVEEEICNDGADNNCDGSPGECSLSGDLPLSQAYALYNSTRAGSEFGAAVVLHPDFNVDGYADLIAGAPSLWNDDEDIGGVAQVSRIVGGSFHLNEEHVVITAKQAGAAAQEAFGFGHSVAIAGDLDGDGLTDLVVGAPTDNSGGDVGGSFYAMVGPTYMVPIREASLLGGKGMSLGWAIAAGEDVSGDGHFDALIGAPAIGSLNPGGAYLHFAPLESAGTLNEDSVNMNVEPLSSVLAAITGPAEMRTFGYDLVMGDTTGDGVSDLIISAPNASFIDGVNEEGVMTFECPCTGSLTAEDAHTALTQTSAGGFGFGWSIDLVDDIDDDGLDELLVGAPYRDDESLKHSVAMLFSSTSTWNGDATRIDNLQSSFSGDVIIFSSDEYSDGLGQNVRDIGDLDDDGRNDIAISHMGGTTYVFTAFDFGENYDVTDATASIYSEKNVDEGMTVFGGVDINNDAISDLAIGVPTTVDKKFGGTIGVFLGGGY